MTHPRLVELIEYLAQQRRSLLDAASAVPSDGWQTRPAPDSWSVSEVLEHLGRVERSVAAVLTKRIAQARAAGHPAETETSSVIGSLDHFGLSRVDHKLVAPEIAMPIENPDRETIERMLTESRDALLAAIATGDGLALGEIKHTNMRFGELDLYQWILFVAEHETRHTSQLRDVARLSAMTR